MSVTRSKWLQSTRAASSPAMLAPITMAWPRCAAQENRPVESKRSLIANSSHNAIDSTWPDCPPLRDRSRPALALAQRDVDVRGNRGLCEMLPGGRAPSHLEYLAL